MKPKPDHLGLKYAMQFQDNSIADVYQHRVPYTAEAIDVLVGLITDQPRTVLDVGCGTGDLARGLVEHVERVDAVDFSQAMLDKGKTLPGGNHPHLNWIYGRVEEATLQPPYALITAGASLHWMEWDIVMPLFQRILTPHGYLALVERGTTGLHPWNDDLLTLIRRFSTNQEFRPYNLVEELEQRHLFQQQGKTHTQPIPFVQSGEDYIQSIHSMNGFSRERMGEEAANTFDDEVRKLIAPFLQDGQLMLSVISIIEWGKPLSM
jgi:ubiquinone/menaquinone biosynthesis C-methylase UbiE